MAESIQGLERRRNDIAQQIAELGDFRPGSVTPLPISMTSPRLTRDWRRVLVARVDIPINLAACAVDRVSVERNASMMWRSLSSPSTSTTHCGM